VWVCHLLAIRRAAFGGLRANGLARTMGAFGLLVLVCVNRIVSVFGVIFGATVPIQPQFRGFGLLLLVLG